MTSRAFGQPLCLGEDEEPIEDSNKGARRKK